MFIHPKLRDAAAIGSYHIEQAHSEFKSKMLDLMEESPANKDFYGAVLDARELMAEQNLMEPLDAGYSGKYSSEQVGSAAISAREDVAAVKAVQIQLLKRLDVIRGNQHQTFEVVTAILQLNLGIRRLVWVLVALLLYVAIRVS